VKAEKQAEKVQAENSQSAISKPKGQAGRGDGYNLEKAMGLPTERYNRLLVSPYIYLFRNNPMLSTCQHATVNCANLCVVVP